MNFYIKYIDKDDSFGIGQECTIFYEVIDNYATRQLLLSEGKFIGSNRKDEKLDYFLAECSISIEDFESAGGNLQMITEEEFEEAWRKHCERYKDEWDKSKNEFKVGMKVQGEVEVIYPQGIIVRLDEKTVAITDYNECINNSFVDSIYPNQCVNGSVKEYDEKNMWIVIQDSRITK